MKNLIQTLAMVAIAFFYFFSSNLSAQSPALDAAFATKSAVLETADSVSTSFKPAQYPDFSAEFEKKFVAKWGNYERETLKKIESAKTKKELSLIQTMAKTEYSAIVFVIFYELLEQADGVYQKNFDAQKANLSFSKKNHH